MSTLTHKQKHYGLLALLFASYSDTLTRILTNQPHTSLKLALFNKRVNKDLFIRVLKHFIVSEIPTVVHPCEHSLPRPMCVRCASVDNAINDIVRLAKTACQSAVFALNRAVECGADADEVLQWVVDVNTTAVPLVREQMNRPTFGSTCGIYDALCNWEDSSNCSRFGFACCVVQLTCGLPCPILAQPFDTLSQKDVKELFEIIIPWFKPVAERVKHETNITWPRFIQCDDAYRFIRFEYAPVAINFITKIQEHHLKFYQTVVSIMSDVWGINRHSGVVSSLLTIQYKDLLIHPLSNMFNVICPLFSVFSLWTSFLGTEFNNMCVQNVCCSCWRAVNMSVPLVLPQCLCLQCFESWSTCGGVDIAQQVINVLCTSPSIGPPMTQVQLSNWKRSTFSPCTHRFKLHDRQRGEFSSFIELVFEMRRRGIPLQDCVSQNLTKLVCLKVNADSTVGCETVYDKTIAKGLFRLFKEDARVLALHMHNLQLPYNNQMVTMVVELQKKPEPHSVNQWATTIGQMYDRIPHGWQPAGPAYIIQECSPTKCFKGLVDIFAAVAMIAVGHAVGINTDHDSRAQTAWTMTRVNKKSNEHNVVYHL